MISPAGWTVEEKSAKYTVPYGSYVGVSHIVPHHDSNKYFLPPPSHSLLNISRWGDDCAEFNPNRPRLLEKSKDIRSFTTFSSGAHICPGRHIAVIVSLPPLPSLYLSADYPTDRPTGGRHLFARVRDANREAATNPSHLLRESYSCAEGGSL